MLRALNHIIVVLHVETYLSSCFRPLARWISKEPCSIPKEPCIEFQKSPILENVCAHASDPLHAVYEFKHEYQYTYLYNLLCMCMNITVDFHVEMYLRTFSDVFPQG